MKYEWMLKGFGYDTALEFIFALIAFIVAYHGYKVYKYTKEPSSKYLTLGFFLLGFANIIHGSINLFFRINGFTGYDFFINGSLFVYFVVYAVGLASLVYMTLNLNKASLYLLVAGLSTLAIIAALQNPLYFYIVILLLFLYILAHYLVVYIQTKNSKMLLVLIGLLLIAIGNLNLVVAFLYNKHYLVAHLIKLIGYLAILAEIVYIKYRKK